MRPDKRKYHVLYKTTCLSNGRFYIGMHSTDDLSDGYMGSGTKLSYSIKAHGRSNHTTEILELLDTRNKLKKREAEVITEDVLKNPLCMNMCRGGCDGIRSLTGMGAFAGKQHTQTTKNKVSESITKIKKRFTLISPTGECYTEELFTGLVKMCKEHGLSHVTIYRIFISGKQPRCGKAKGWNLQVDIL